MITPHESQPKLAAALGIPALYFKREDLHPYGSHKGRSIPPMMDQYAAAGDRRFAISSSGNAALAAALHAQKIGVELDVFVGTRVAPHKLEKLKKLADASAGRVRVLSKERPLQALTLAVQEGARSLRQSTDDAALTGYGELAAEIAELSRAETKVGAVFIGTSSGTTAQALAAYFIEQKLPIHVHIVQTSSCHPIADAFDAFDVPSNEISLADAIVDITAARKPALVPLIEKTGGRGWCATNEQLETALKLVEKHAGMTISPNSALSVAGALQAAYMGYEIDGAVVCLVCGD